MLYRYEELAEKIGCSTATLRVYLGRPEFAELKIGRGHINKVEPRHIDRLKELYSNAIHKKSNLVRKFRDRHMPSFLKYIRDKLIDKIRDNKRIFINRYMEYTIESTDVYRVPLKFYLEDTKCIEERKTVIDKLYKIAMDNIRLIEFNDLVFNIARIEYTQDTETGATLCKALLIMRVIN